MRPRIKVKSGLLGSSDWSHVQAYRGSLQRNHKEFVGSELHISLMAKEIPEPKPDQMVKVRVWGKSMIVPYYKAKSLNLDWEYV